jgi:hypothetical protein
VTTARRAVRASHAHAHFGRGWTLPRLVLGTAGLLIPAVDGLCAQGRPEAPITPVGLIGTVTDAATLSVLGLAAASDGNGSPLSARNDLWFGVTQPLARLGRVRVTALASGTTGVRDAAGRSGAMHGLATVRARARFGDQHVWSAVSYGRGTLDGEVTASTMAAMGMMGASAAAIPFGRAGADTTISRRVDLGQMGRAEAGLLTTQGGVVLAFGVAMERATRVTTQTLRIETPESGIDPMFDGAARIVTNRTMRSLQRRDVATGLASAGFQTGATQWLVSVTAPVATWVSSDALSPNPRPLPTVASVAMVRPLTGWLSLVGAAASNTATMDGGSLREAVRGRADRAFSPVVAVGLRLSRLPWRSSDGTPSGILAFETRTLGAVDAMSLEALTMETAIAAGPSSADTLRVVLLIDAPRAESVELMGDATSWAVTPMRRTTSGRWRAELKLAPGMHRVIVRADGGKWTAPPGLPVGNDDYGEPVGLLQIRGRL